MIGSPLWSVALSATGAVVGAGTIAATGADPFNPLWGLIGSVAGGLTSLYFQPWKEWGAVQIVWWVFIATAFAFLVAPLVFREIEDSQAGGGIFYLMAAGTSILLPKAVRWVGRALGDGAEGPK